MIDGGGSRITQGDSPAGSGGGRWWTDQSRFFKFGGNGGLGLIVLEVSKSNTGPSKAPVTASSGGKTIHVFTWWSKNAPSPLNPSSLDVNNQGNTVAAQGWLGGGPGTLPKCAGGGAGGNASGVDGGVGHPDCPSPL